MRRQALYSFFQGDSYDIGHESRLLIPCHFSGVFRPSGRLTCKLWGAGLINADKVTDESDVVIHEAGAESKGLPLLRQRSGDASRHDSHRV